MRKMMIAAAFLAASTPALAQVGNSQGLIAVTVNDVNLLNNFLNDTQIAALNNVGIPVTVQAPISVAANVCGTTVNALGALRKEGNGACTATSGSAALADIIQRQKLKQNKQ